MIRQLIAAALACTLTNAAHAAPTTAVLGDSLSDPCNLWNIDPSAVPNPPYPDKQFTNGNTWATQLGSDCDSGANFAYGGAKAAPSTTNKVYGLTDFPGGQAVDIPDLEQQTDMFLASSFGSSPDIRLTAIWIGANDLFDTLENASNPLTLPLELIAAANTVVEKVVESVVKIANAGPPNTSFVIFGLPKLGDTPLISPLEQPVPALMNAVTVYLNDLLEAAATVGALADLKTEFFDIEFYFQDIMANPAAYGLVNATDSCLQNPLCGTSIDPNTYLFYDLVHPSQAGHTIILDTYNNLFPVPLPAGLPLYLAGLGVVLGFGFRKARAS